MVNVAISNAWEYTPTVKWDTTGNRLMFFWGVFFLGERGQ